MAPTSNLARPRGCTGVFTPRAKVREEIALALAIEQELATGAMTPAPGRRFQQPDHQSLTRYCGGAVALFPRIGVDTCSQRLSASPFRICVGAEQRSFAADDQEDYYL